MKKNVLIRSAIVIVCLILLTGALTACGSPTIIGKWVASDGSTPFGFPNSMEFFSDGTCVVDRISGEY